ncbi:MAG: hypothetical protein PHH48_06375 [Eubacteriales bacterium]|nr:hypothetical protein [Eubacteriales bacterium]
MAESRTILCRNLLEKTQSSVKILERDPEKGLFGLNECVALIFKIYDSFES